VPSTLRFLFLDRRAARSADGEGKPSPLEQSRSLSRSS